MKKIIAVLTFASLSIHAISLLEGAEQVLLQKISMRDSYPIKNNLEMHVQDIIFKGNLSQNLKSDDILGLKLLIQAHRTIHTTDKVEMLHQLTLPKYKILNSWIEMKEREFKRKLDNESEYFQEATLNCLAATASTSLVCLCALGPTVTYGITSATMAAAYTLCIPLCTSQGRYSNKIGFLHHDFKEAFSQILEAEPDFFKDINTMERAGKAGNKEAQEVMHQLFGESY